MEGTLTPTHYKAFPVYPCHEDNLSIKNKMAGPRTGLHTEGGGGGGGRTGISPLQLEFPPPPPQN